MKQTPQLRALRPWERAREGLRFPPSNPPRASCCGQSESTRRWTVSAVRFRPQYSDEGIDRELVEQALAHAVVDTG